MENLTYERYLHDDQLRAEMKAAAGRERARAMNRFLRNAARALLGDRSESERERIVQRIQPCEAC